MPNNDFHIQSSSNTLFLKYDKNWAIDGYKNRFGESLIGYAKALKVSQWAAIDDISNWPVKLPEEMDMCSDIATTLVDLGFRHCAVCGHEYAISKWMMEKVLPKEVEIAFFNTLQESKDWLNGLGYETNFD